jgi:hypothetical protein
MFSCCWEIVYKIEVVYKIREYFIIPYEKLR